MTPAEHAWSGAGVGRMHDGEADTDAALVRRLLAEQFPHWAELPIERLASGGTVNAVYRLGAAHSVRLPLTEGGAEDVEREARILPALAPLLPVEIPTVVGTGRPGAGFPWAWSVHTWIDGDTPIEGGLTDPEPLARDLARLVTALRAIDVDGPPAYRAGPLTKLDEGTRAAIKALAQTDEPVDPEAATAVWEQALAAPDWSGRPVWLHSDLMPSNLLTRQGRLAAVIDFATAGLGDPAADLIPAWNLLPSHARETFRAEVGMDEATWTRGKGWALAMALIQLPYYRNTNKIISANARHTINQALS